MPASASPRGNPSHALSATRALESTTRGSTARGIRSRASSSSSQSSAWMSKSSVREALLASVMCALPPDSCHAIHASTVPNASSPRSARARAPGTLSSSHASLVPEKYASSTRPVLRAKRAAWPDCRRASHRDAVRRSCHTMAFAIGAPVARSQTTVVSRWLVSPRAEISPGARPARSMAAAATSRWEAQISRGSCSTQPGRGKIWRNSCCAIPSIRPSCPKAMARELVVPWSKASTAFIVEKRAPAVLDSRRSYVKIRF